MVTRFRDFEDYGPLSMTLVDTNLLTTGGAKKVRHNETNIKHGRQRVAKLQL